jgi:regulator of cell morphogenesis and NO signaling
MQMSLKQTQTVAEIARQYPATVAVFEALGIDYCCGGNKSLRDACAKQNVSVDRVLSELADALAVRPAPGEQHWMTATLADLCSYIVDRHHGFTKRELPRLSALAEKVEQRHAHMHPELHQIRELVHALNSEMSTHMLKEEQVLFPRLKVVEDSAARGTPAPPAFFGALINPIRHMMTDHDDTAELFRSLRNLTHSYHVPEDACASFRALYEGIQALEVDIHQHVHLENNILFPHALEFEKSGPAPAAAAVNAHVCTGELGNCRSS